MVILAALDQNSWFLKTKLRTAYFSQPSIKYSKIYSSLSKPIIHSLSAIAKVLDKPLC